VRHHLTAIFAKLGVSGRMALALYACQHGLAKLPCTAGTARCATHDARSRGVEPAGRQARAAGAIARSPEDGVPGAEARRPESSGLCGVAVHGSSCEVGEAAPDEPWTL